MNATNAADKLSTPRALALAEGIAGRLFNDGAIDLSDAELHRVLSPCSGGNNLVTAAQQLRDAGKLTLAAEWIAKRHRHASESGAVCCCDSPDVTSTITNETQIELVNPETNEIEWSGPWSEFLAANEEDVLSHEEGDVLASTGIVFIGGGAQPEVCIRLAVQR